MISIVTRPKAFLEIKIDWIFKIGRCKGKHKSVKLAINVLCSDDQSAETRKSLIHS